MKRKIYQQLLDWKEKRNGEVALLVEGARRIGKSYIVEEFAKNEYESYIFIDFNKAPRMVRDFLLQKDKVTNRHNIRPIEVKSGKNYTLSSLAKCMKKFGEYMTTPTILHAADYKVEGDVTYLPLYMTPLL